MNNEYLSRNMAIPLTQDFQIVSKSVSDAEDLKRRVSELESDLDELIDTLKDLGILKGY